MIMDKNNNKNQCIYTVFEVYERIGDTISTDCNVFKTEEKALNFFNEFMENHIKDFRLDDSDYGYDEDTKCFYTNRGMEDIVLYLSEHEVSNIENTTFSIVIEGIKEVDEYLQGNVTVFENKDDANSFFNKEIDKFIDNNDLDEDDYYLDDYYKTFSMKYDLDIEDGEKSDYCIDIFTG